MNQNALELRELRKSFSGFSLEDLTLTLPAGCIMGLIGENGAGKSTTMKLILRLLQKDGGSVTLLGRGQEEAFPLTLEEVGVVLDEAGFPEYLTAQQVGRVMGHIYGGWDQAEYERLCRALALPERKPFRDLSFGMKRKLSIAVALSHGAKLLLLDEPTSGLDPVARDQVVELLYDFTRGEDRSILISSHIVSDLERLCDYIAFLHRGRLLLCEEKDALLAQYGLVRCTAAEAEAVERSAVKYRRETPYGVELLVRRDAAPRDWHVSPVTIEELFVYMVKGGEGR